ncbi:MAG: zinc-ribbon domain-containing protein [Chloroflexi bacterium]|nr:zinc-ribbon domain-containing protein [Chloroflexota bacterium]
MKNIWKWILGILIVLVIVAGLVGLAFVVRNHMITANFRAGYGFQPQQRGNLPPQGGNAQPRGWNGPMMRGGDGWGRPMMGGRGFGFSRFGRMPFGFLFGGVMGLIPLALLALVLYGAYRMGKSSVKPMVIAATSTPSIATHACAKCGTAVQDGSKFCLECGKKQ